MDSVWSSLPDISETLPTDSSCTLENSSEGQDDKYLDIYMIYTARCCFHFFFSVIQLELVLVFLLVVNFLGFLSCLFFFM